MGERSWSRNEREDLHRTTEDFDAGSPNKRLTAKVLAQYNDQRPSWDILHSRSNPDDPYQISRQAMHKRRPSVEPESHNHPLWPKFPGMQAKMDRRHAAAGQRSEAPERAPMQSSVAHHASRVESWHVHLRSSGLLNSLQGLGLPSVGCSRDASSSLSADPDTCPDSPESCSEAAASPLPQQARAPLHKFTASLASSFYQQMPSEEAAGAAEQELTKAEDRELLQCLSELAGAARAAGKPTDRLSKSSVMWILRDLLLMLPESSEYKALLGDDDAVMDIYAAPDAPRMCLVCGALLECCRLEPIEVLMYIIGDKGKPTYAFSLICKFCQSSHLHKPEQEQLLDILIGVLLSYVELKASPGTVSQSMMEAAASFLVLRDGLPPGLAFQQERIFHTSALFPRCLLDKQCSWQSKQTSAKRSMEIQPAVLFLDLMTAVGKEDFGWLIEHVICSKSGSMLCDQAAFILERKDRGAKVTDLAEILFVWAEGSFIHSPLDAEEVLRFAVHLGLVMQGDMSVVVLQSALLPRPRCMRAFAAMAFRSNEERKIQLNVLRRVSAELAASGHPPAQHADILLAYLGRDAIADFVTPSAAEQMPQACIFSFVLIKRAAQLSEQIWELDRLCEHQLASVSALVASFSRWFGVRQVVIDAAGVVLLALAAAERLVKDMDLFSPLLAALVAIKQVSQDAQMGACYRNAIGRLASLRLCI
ncbi:g4488 [Coccomyxa elongata]